MRGNFTYLFMRGVLRFASLLRNNFLSFVTLATALFIYHIFWVAGTGSAGFLNHISNAGTVRVYLNGDNEIIAGDIINILKSMENVADAKYFSPKDAKSFAVASAPKAAGLKSFAEEFFPAFIEVKVYDSSEAALDMIVEGAARLKGVDEASYGREYMEKFRAIGRGAWIFIAAMSVLFAMSAVFVLYNTVKLSLYKFKDEIKLYSLVGATRTFISVPYLIGGFFMGFFSFIVSLIVFTAVFMPFNSHVLIKAGINIFTMPDILYFAVCCAAVCLISVLSSGAGVASFLKQVSSINED